MPSRFLVSLRPMGDALFHRAEWWDEEEHHVVEEHEHMPLAPFRGEVVHGRDAAGVPALDVDHDELVQGGVALLLMAQEVGHVLGLDVRHPCTFTSTDTRTSICASTSTSLY